MAITLTKFIYPLKEEIILSKSLGYTLDNPRTEEEIKFIKDYLDHPLRSFHSSSVEEKYNPMLSAAFAIDKLRKSIAGKDDYVHEYLEKNRSSEIDDIISESWIIIRYKDNGEFEKVKENRNALFDILFTDARDGYWNEYNSLLNYCHLISLLSHNDNNYPGDSFVLLNKPHSIFYSKDHVHEIVKAFQTFYGWAGIVGNRGTNWDYFPDFKDNLVNTLSHLEKIFEESPTLTIKKPKRQSNKEKLMFIGDLLRVIGNETKDVKVKLLLLVSIIEFLVTRNPDSDKFNVKDSISKQFVLKCSILVYQDNNLINLTNLKESLRGIYKQRSNVAHGNFLPVGEDKKMLESFFLLYYYIKAIVKQFLKDPEFVNYLKES